MDKFSPIHVMIMENCLPNVDGYKLHHVFDIKGSKFSREVLKHKSDAQLGQHPITGGEVLKDIDFERFKEIRKFMELSSADYSKLVAQISKDSQFLRKHSLMDYSLLLSIRKVESKKER